MSFECAAEAQLGSDDVALVVHRGDIGRHIGFAVFTQKGKHEFLHLAFHKDVRIENYPPERCSIVGKLPFDWVALFSLKKALWNIGKKAQQKSAAVSIPFGVSIDTKKGSFNREGAYKTPLNANRKPADGLTCATFVTEICRGVGLPLVKDGDWTVRPGDATWIDEICRLLAKVKAEPDHIAHVRASFTGARIRPEEVAGAATVWNIQAVKCKQAEAAGLDIIAKLSECCPEAVALEAAAAPRASTGSAPSVEAISSLSEHEPEA